MPTIGSDSKEHQADFGDDNLLKQLNASAKEPHSIPTIFLFDRDTADIVAKVEEPGAPYKRWGNNVYSFALPVPPHRVPENGICIELLYTDEELRTPDSEGRRLFLSTEFNPKSGRHKEGDLNCLDRSKLVPENRNLIKLIDSNVFDENNANVALSKSDFARFVLDGPGHFKLISPSTFSLVLDIVEDIIDEAQPQYLPFFSTLTDYLRSLRELSPQAK